MELRVNIGTALGIALLATAGASQASPFGTHPARGTVLSSKVLTSYTRVAIANMLRDDPSHEQPSCNVRVAEFTYATIGVEGEPATASAALLVPGGPQCQGPYPLLAWGEGTQTLRSTEQAKDIRDARGNDPLVTRLASQGYVVVATDYLGLGKSNYPYHPYMHSASQASAMIDAMRAARSVLRRLNTPLSGKVMLSGNSAGAHAALATQREIEAHLSQEFNLAASSGISGPYALSESALDDLTGRNTVAESTFALVFLSYAITSMQRTYHNIYLAPSQTYQDPWAAQVEAFFPGTRSVGDLVTTLPPVGKIKDYFTAAFLQDVANNPFNPLRQDLQRNDLLNWRPSTRTLLCGSSNDASVPFKNATRAIDTFKRNGSNQVTTLDLGTGKREDNSAFVHLAVEESCIVAVRQQLLDHSR
ncbi:lipase family protein [Xanthomonas arboricola]|uniref:lipase family protein n=1 Tax=Xanthomonas arboricola TaxID=56448 RepID=UPI000E1F75C1|nr:lipase family protein [Xanthomonas arboricola]